mmetsp:Transcript_40669/g.86615  ORF Transcript_40669/g.86615 Transcript_40669/m.86615 type:complete len:397 (-) Transcript_40669:183-1373(-)
MLAIFSSRKTMKAKAEYTKAILVFSALAIISALALWKNGDPLSQTQQRSAKASLPRHLTLSHSGMDSGQQCKDGPPVFRQRTTIELDFLQEVHECTQDLEKIIEVETKKWPPQLEAKTPMLVCDAEEVDTMSQLEFVRSTIKKYRHIWFVGDSILRQQFNTLQCMLDPSARAYWTYLLFDHLTNSISFLDEDYPLHLNQPGPLSTIIEMRSWGWMFDHSESPLYETTFPSILRVATENDAIILNAGAHYNDQRVNLMEKALRFIAQQSLKTNATIYYIEPTPEEWKTSNGMYRRGTHQGCSTLTKDQLIDGSPPASWRSDLARSIFANSESNDHMVNFVPTFWQLIATNHTTNRNEYDCTHKSLSAAYFMNSQLLRAIMDNQRNLEQAIMNNQDPL